MSAKWPLGSEVKRRETANGAMLYDASRAGNLQPLIFDPEQLRRRGLVEQEAQGRGTAWFIRMENRSWVLRHYRRGGLMARLWGDRYPFRTEDQTRPFAEWQLTYHLYRAGLPVPAPIAARYVRQGNRYRGDLITERLPDTRTLAQAVQEGPQSLLTWISVGRCLRLFHDRGVCHADLNARNILLDTGTGLRTAVWLIDFDRGSLRAPGWWSDANLVRLRRSLEKISWGLPPEHFTEADWHGLLDGYQQAAGSRAPARAGAPFSFPSAPPPPTSPLGPAD